jgi:hypothetical protein
LGKVTVFRSIVKGTHHDGAAFAARKKVSRIETVGVEAIRTGVHVQGGHLFGGIPTHNIIVDRWEGVTKAK